MDLGSGRIREFGPALGARYVPGYLVYADEDGRLFRRPFDLDRIEPSGSAERIASNVAYAEGRLGRVGLGLSGLFPSFDVSSTGTLVYRTAAIPTSTSQHLTVFDRAGRQLQVIPGRVPWTPRFSPDGRRVAYGAFAPGSSLNDARDLWITDVAAGTTQRVTTDANDNNDPHWSPDGQSVAYSALDTGSRKELRVQPLTGGRARRATVRPNTLPLGTEWPSDWSSDGRVLLFTQVATGEDDMDLWVQPVAGDTARPYLTTTAREFGARLSPDGRWAAYTSNETGRNEVYVQAFPTPGPKTPVSVGGGHGPVWRGDGKELYFWHDGQLFAVAVDGPGPGQR
jgi:dipeptidyl aminopeptidase/acylaminoacyl peptidase